MGSSVLSDLSDNDMMKGSHQIGMEFLRIRPFLSNTFFIVAVIFFSAGCNIVKKDTKTALLLQTSNSTQSALMDEVNRFARVNSMHAKMYLKFEDNSFAEFGNKEVYRSADGDVVVQRPGKIYLKVQVPIIHSDVAQMTSDGKTFRVAVLQDNAGGKYKKFVKGNNNADYSKLQQSLKDVVVDGTKATKESVNAFANIRPQHFTDAMLVRPTETTNAYSMSTTFQIEEDATQPAKSPLRQVMRGYYFLDEFSKEPDGSLQIQRRFWFDRVGGIRLARQQLFDPKGEIETDIVYGKEGKLTESNDFANLPLQIQVTRPKEKYSMRLSYMTPEDVQIGETYPDRVFDLKNSWGLEEVDLDERLRQANAEMPAKESKAMFFRDK